MSNTILDNKISGDAPQSLGKIFFGLIKSHNTGMSPLDIAVRGSHAAITILPPGAGALLSKTLRESIERKDKMIWASNDILGPLKQPWYFSRLVFFGLSHLGYALVTCDLTSLIVTPPQYK